MQKIQDDAKDELDERLQSLTGKTSDELQYDAAVVRTCVCVCVCVFEKNQVLLYDHF